MTEMDVLSGVKFYSLSNQEGVFEVVKIASKTSYGESFNEIQLYCEAGDWAVVGNGKIIHNLGENIARWAKDSYQYCIPASKESNDFIESHSPGSSYYSFISIHNGESVVARYLFEGNEWEIIFQIQNESPEIQILDSNTFVNYFDTADDDAKIYLERILRLFPVGKNNAIETPIFLTSKQENEEEEWEMEARFPCDCYTHEMSFYSCGDMRLAEFGYWQRGRGEQPWGWKTRIKMVWDILTTGNPYSDMIILSRENAQKLRDTLNDYLEKTK